MKLPATGTALEIYLNDHLAGATGGVELAARMAKSHSDDAQAKALEGLASAIKEDREALLRTMRCLLVPVRQYKVVAGWAMEKLGRFKPNGHVLERSPLADLVELEALQLGVQGKADLWLALRAITGSEDRLDGPELDQLIDRAGEQLRTVARLHHMTAARVLAGQ